MGVYDSIDIDFSWDGDFQLSDDGDIKMNGDDYIRATETAIQTIVKGEFGDWQHDSGVATGLSDFIGEPNTRENGEKIANRVKSRLVANGVAEASDITVRVTPINREELVIIIRVEAASTSGNRLRAGEGITISTVFNSTEGGTFSIPRKASERDAQQQ